MKDLASIRVEEIMTSPVVAVPASLSLRETAKVVEGRRISCAVVEDGGVPVGIVTERDLVRSLSRGVDPDESVGAHVGKQLVSVDAGVPVGQVLSVMQDCSIRHLPVVSSGKVVGLVTQTNIMRFSEEVLKGYSEALEEQVRRQTVELHQAAEFKDRILGMAAHDLRTPLTVVAYWSEVLETLGEGEEVEGLDRRQILRMIGDQAAQMNKLISDLLDITRIQQGKLVLRLAPADIRDILASRLDVYAALAHKKGISLERSLGEGLPMVEMDSERVGGVVDNLVSNAVKFCGKGDSILVRTESMAEGGIRVEVEDSGQGISEQDMPKLFTEFAKLGAKPTANETSTGLGLAIVKKVVEQHGGQVYARSTLGKGSTFGFSLPAKQPAGPAPAAPAAQQQQSAAA
ncbi:MAG: CBS domain-containing protein [Elusimicrobia bacterium]|nr:CBS domain-containing protein [Elusimicrobiota bacterium]